MARREYTDEELQSITAHMIDAEEEAQKEQAYANLLGTALTTKPIDRAKEKALRTLNDINTYYDIVTAKTQEEKQKILKDRKEQQMMYSLNSSGLNSASIGTVGMVSDMITGGLTGSSAVAVKKGIKYGIEKAIQKQAKDISTNALTEVRDIIVKGKTDWDKKFYNISNDATDVLTQAGLQTPTNLFVDNVDSQGNVATSVDESVEGFVGTMLTNALFDAAITSVPSIAIRSALNTKARRTIDSAYEENNFAKSNLKGDELSTTFNDDMIKDIENNNIKMDELKQAIKQVDDSAIPDFTNIAKDADDMANILDKLDNEYNAYIVRHGDDIYAKTEKGERLVGKYVDGDVLFDIKNSDIPASMKYKKINGMPILQPIDYKTVKEYKDGKKYHTFKSIKVDNAGNFVKEDGTILTKFEADKLNKDLKDYKTDGLTQRFDNANILKQHILTPMSEEKIATLKDSNIKAIKEEMNKIKLDDNSIVATTRVRSDFDINSPEAKALQLIYNDVEEKGNTIKFKNPADEVNEAIKYAIVKKINSFNEDSSKGLDKFKKNLVNNVTNDVATTLFDKNNIKISTESAKELLKPIVEKAVNEKNIGAYIDEKRVKIDEYGTSTLDINKDIFDAVNENISVLNKKKYYTAKEWQHLEDNKKVNASSAVTIDENGNISIDRDIAIKYENALAEANIPFTINDHAFEVIKEFLKSIKKDFKDGKISAKAIRLVKDMDDYTASEIKEWYNSLNEDMQKEIKDAIQNILDGFDEIENMYNSTNRDYYEEIYFTTKMTTDGRVYYEHPINPKTKLGRILFLQRQQLKNLSEMDEDAIATAKRSILGFFGEKPYKMTDDEVNSKFEEIVTTPKDELFKTNTVYDDGITSVYIYENAKRLYEFEKTGKNNFDFFFDISEVDGINNGYAIQASYINKKVESVGLGSKPTGDDIYTQYANNIIKNLKDVDLTLERSDTKSVTTADMYSASAYEVTKSIAKSLISKIHNAVKITNDIEKKQELLQNVILEDKLQYANNINIKVKINGTKINVSWSKYKDKLKDLYTNYYKKLYDYGKNINIKDIENDVINKLSNSKKISEQVKPLYNFLKEIANDINNKQTNENIKNVTVKDLIGNKNIKDLVKDIVATSKQIGYIKYKAKITDYELSNILHKFTKYQGGKFFNAIKKASKETLGKDIVLFREILSDIQNLISIKFTKNYIDKKFNHTKAKTHIKMLGEILDADSMVINKALKKIEKTKKYSIKDILTILSDSGATITEKAMQYKPIKEITPKIPTAFEPVIATSFKGYAGYSEARKINFQAPTPIGVLNPVFTLSHDASIMARARGDNLSLWDAVIGTTESINDFSKKANDLINDILATDYVAILDSTRKELYDDLFNEKDGFMSKDNEDIKNHLAEQRLLSKGKKITKENISKEKEKIDADFNKYLTTGNDLLAEKIKRLQQYVEENKKEWKDGDVIAQYYIGIDGTEAKYDSNRNVDIKKDEKQFVTTKDIGTEYLSNVEPLDGIQVALSLNGKNFTNIDFKEPDIKFNQNDTQYVDNTVMLAFDKESVANFHNIGKIIHEISHHTIDKLRALGDNNIGLLQHFFEERFMQGLFTDKDGNVLSIDGDVTQELLSILTEKLLHNDIIASNPRLFAKAYNTKNLKALIEANSIYYRGEKINSFDNLIDIINAEAKSQFKKKLKQDLIAIQRNTFVAFKSNEQILAGLNGIKLKEKFNSTLKDLDSTFLNMNKVLTRGYNKGYAKIEDISLLEAFDITGKKEALYYALSLKDGFVKTIDDATAKFKDEFISIKNKYGITDREDRYAGNALMLGLQHFRNILKDVTTSDEFLNRIKIDVDKYFDKVKVYFEDKNSVAMLSKLENTISNDALGYYSSKNKIVKVIDDILDKLIATEKIEPKDRLKIKDTLYEYAKRRATYYKFFGKFEKIDNEYNIVVSNEKNKKVEIFKNSLGRVVATLKSNDNFSNYLDAVFYHHEKYKNNENLFGVNPSLQATRTYLVGVKKSKFKGNKKDVIGEVYIGKDIYYVVNRDKLEYTIGYQESDLLNVATNEHMAGVYKFKLKGKNREYFINPQSLKLSNNNIDSKASTMLTRNFYYQLRKREEPKIAMMQYNQIKKAGLLFTKDEIPADDMENYIKLPAKNSISRIGTQYYIHKKYSHYFVGTKGVDYGKVIDEVLGKNELGKFVKGGVKLIIEATKVLRGTILLTHASSYINSFVGSMIILNAHTNGKGNLYIKRVGKLLDEYKNTVNYLITEEIKNGNNTDKYKALQQKLENHILHNAFRHGLSSTIRSSAMHLGVYEENFIVKKLNKMFKDDRAGEAFKFITLNENTKIGAKLGEWFDKTEMYPKLALYLYELDKHNDYELAIKTTLMSFPTYYNLNGYLASFDELSPYTKYMYNIPKMLLYAGVKTPYATTLAYAAIPAISSMTWDEEDDKKYDWFQQHGFMKIDEDTAYFSHNLNPYSLPIEWEHESLLDSIFVYNVISKGSWKPDINPFISLE